MIPNRFRKGGRIALVALYPQPDPALPPFIPNLGLYQIAAAVTASEMGDLDVRIWDETSFDLDRTVSEIEDFDPDIVGFSAYVWSLYELMKIHAEIKKKCPDRLTIFGGPSARENMLAHHPFARMAQPDLLVVGEGEKTIIDILSAPQRDIDAFRKISGVVIRHNGAWHQTKPRHPALLDSLASPYHAGLIPQHGLGIMETYRGCPFSCSFCEWGVMESPKNVRSVDGIINEFQAISENGRSTVLFADAGLNLNKPAFANLSTAAKVSGFLRDRSIICEVYPMQVKDEHLAFLDSAGSAHVGVGLQSFDKTVLNEVERRYDDARFNDILGELRSVATLAIEIILGLPGDSPKKFRENFARARRFPYALRVYHCLVLPSALMARSPKAHMLDYDPLSLKMQSCLGWSRANLSEAVDFLNSENEIAGGAAGEYFWVFPPP